MIFILSLVSLVFFVTRIATKEKSKQQTLCEKIERRIIRSLDPEEDSWWDTEGYLAYIEKIFELQKNLQQKDITSLSFATMKSLEKSGVFRQTSVLDDTDTWDDLNLFCGNPKSRTLFLGSIFDKTITPWGSKKFYHNLANPSDIVDELKNKQNCIIELVVFCKISPQIFYPEL